MELVGGEDLGGVELACNAVLGSVELAHNMELGGAQKTTPHDPHGVGWWRTEGGVGAWRRRKARVEATAAAHKGCFFIMAHRGCWLQHRRPWGSLLQQRRCTNETCLDYN
jgi:hypothetical protein